MIRRFELKDVNKSGAVFDIDKLNWLNGKYIRNADIKRIVDLSIPYLKEAGLITGEVDASLYRWLVKVIDVARTGVDYLKQIPEETSLFFKKNVEFEDKSKAIEEFSQDGVTEVFTTLVNKLKQLETLTPEAIDGIFKEMKKELPVSPRTIYHPVRLALTGLNSGPEIKNVIYILGDQ